MTEAEKSQPVVIHQTSFSDQRGEVVAHAARAFFSGLRVMVVRFWAEAPGSVKNHLNTDELARIVIASLTAGSGLFGLVQAIASNVGTIFPASGDAALAMIVLSMILESRRRLGQGRELAPDPRRRRHDHAR